MTGSPSGSPVLVGIDIGTTGVKVVAFDPRSARVVASSSAEHVSETTPDGGHEQDPSCWWASVASCSREVAARLGGRPVTGIGLSGQMHSLLLVDAAGEPVRPAMTWADRRVGEDSRRLADIPAVSRRAGNPVVDAFTAPKLSFIARTEPDAVRRAAHLVLAKDFIGYLLTGEWATDRTDAIGTMLFDVRRSAWDEELFAAVGAPIDLALPVLGSTELRGMLTPAAAAATGFRAGTPVVAGAGDVSAAVLGAGVVDGSAMCLNVGTAAQVMGVSARPEAGPGFVFGDATSDGFVCMASVYAAGASVRWAERSVLGGGINEIAAEGVAGSNGLSYLPFMFGATVPRRNDRVRAAFLGQTERHGPADLASAVLEGIAFACADAIDAVGEVAGRPEAVHLVGGVTGSLLWCEALASVADVELVRLPEGGSPLGAALLAGLGTGVYDDAGQAARALPAVPVERPSGERRDAFLAARARFQAWCELLV